MINSILRLAIERRALFLCSIFFIVGIGIWSYQKLPIDLTSPMFKFKSTPQYPAIHRLKQNNGSRTPLRQLSRDYQSFRIQDRCLAMDCLKSLLFLKRAPISILRVISSTQNWDRLRAPYHLV